MKHYDLPTLTNSGVILLVVVLLAIALTWASIRKDRRR